MSTEASSPRTAAFIGLGNIGEPMAAHLARTGFEVAAFDLRDEAFASVVAAGARRAISTADAVTGVDVIFICLVNEKQLELAVLGPDGVLAAASAGQTLVVHSSVLPESIHRIAAAASEVGLSVIDAPVSGARPAAEAGTLTIMAGGDPAAIDRCTPMMRAYAERVLRMGPLGAGQTAKILNNVVFHGTHLLVMEALRLGQQLDVDEAQLIDAISTSTGSCWVINNWDYYDDILFSHTAAHTEVMYENVTKEMWNAMLLARQQHVALPITAVGVQVSREMHIERERLVAQRLEQAAAAKS
jgi:3-hydroxyisobutyrate dehydrogenase-like beta-hydroxyacid dehydrogenase